MKKILLLVLTYGMFDSAFTQPEVPKKNSESSDKWVITPVPTMKGVLGRLDINFPADVERNILIYQPTGNKFITSVSRNDKIYTIAPGQYRFTLTNVAVDNVPIQKGHETRLKAGFLNIVSEGDWHLYDETKTKAYTSGNKPKKLPLPVGSYQVKLGGQFYPVIIKDGETVEDSSPVEVKDKTPNKIKDETPSKENPEIIGTDKWVMAPLKTNKQTQLANPDLGRLNMNFPAGVDWIFEMFSPAHNDTLFSHTFPDNAKFHDLVPGNYLFKIHKVPIENVPIQKAHETRLKSGFLSVSTDGLGGSGVFVYDISKQTQYWSVHNNKNAAFPVGSYYVKYTGDSYGDVYYYYPMVIKDGQTMEFSYQYAIETGYDETHQWVMTPINEKKIIGIKEKGTGSLNMEFPPGVDWNMLIIRQSDNKLIANFSAENHPQSYPLSPDLYRILLSNVPVKDVYIRKGNETRLKAGIINIVSEGVWDLKAPGETPGALTTYLSGKKPKKFVVPVRQYTLFAAWHGIFSHTVEIRDGKTWEEYGNEH